MVYFYWVNKNSQPSIKSKLQYFHMLPIKLRNYKCFSMREGESKGMTSLQSGNLSIIFVSCFSCVSSNDRSKTLNWVWYVTIRKNWPLSYGYSLHNNGLKVRDVFHILNTCIPVADSCWYMAKPILYGKVKK